MRVTVSGFSLRANAIPTKAPWRETTRQAASQPCDKTMIAFTNPGQFPGNGLAAGVPPGAIGFEITETALVADLRRAAANLEALRARGFEIAIDDFGTGQSSLSHVHRLPLDHIKLDRTFASGLESSRSGRAVATTVLALTRQLDLSCSIEGIETAAQAAAARSLGFRLMQGYYFGKPLPAPLALAALSRAT